MLAMHPAEGKENHEAVAAVGQNMKCKKGRAHEREKGRMAYWVGKGKPASLVLGLKFGPLLGF